MKERFTFRVTYFDGRGRSHLSVTEEWEVRSRDGRPMMSDAVAKLRGLRDSGGQVGMPGGVDEGWPGPVLLECDRAEPRSHLLLPPIPGSLVQVVDRARRLRRHVDLGTISITEAEVQVRSWFSSSSDAGLTEALAQLY